MRVLFLLLFLNFFPHPSAQQEFREIPYLKKFKFKKQDRAFLPEAASTNSVPPSAGSDPITGNSAAPAGILTGGHCGKLF